MKRLEMLAAVTFNVRHALVLALALLLGSGGMVFAGSTPFSQIIVFGDSTSDTGNAYRISQGTIPPSPPYWEGHLCNGPMWVEYLAQDLGMAGSLDNYAVAGATTGYENSTAQAFGGVKDQIELYLSLQQRDPDALYILWAGHNDIFIALASGESPQTVIGRGVLNTLESLEALSRAGARHILVPNLADLGMCPVISQQGQEASAGVSAFCAAYNQVLEATLAAAAIPTMRLNMFAEEHRIASPESGFTDVTHAYLYDGLQAGADPATFVFWDYAHTTTVAQRFIADAARNCLVSYYSPRHGRGSPPALANALNGLVKAKSK